MSGFVSLVGAGPGAPDHLTLRGLDRLRRADLVLYDALVDVSLLELAPNARRFYVGKRAGRHSMEQRTIEALMVRHARAGERVVRLKAGDPFVLGRGGEEALALDAAGVAYEVVPGLSSALTAPAFAGIPLTHRGVSAGFVMISGHDAAAYAPVLASLPSSGLTVVALMGFGRRRDIAERLLAAGWPSDQCCAMVGAAGTESQLVWRGRLDELGHEGYDPGARPVTLVIGEVAGLGSRLGGAVPPVDTPATEPARVEREVIS